jgi:hypothetical protein
MIGNGTAYHFAEDELVTVTGRQLFELATHFETHTNCITSVLFTNSAKWTDIPPLLTATVVTDKPACPGWGHGRCIAYQYRYLSNGWTFWKETVV